MEAVADTACNLDRWDSQRNYVEIWFEAGAMQAQFEYYVDENIPLLAFHGDVTIRPKWDAAVRLLRRWTSNPRPIIILYYGDLDAKGIQIPHSASRDIITFVGQAMQDLLKMPFDDELQARFHAFQNDFQFIRIGLNDEDVARELIARNNLDPNLIEPHLGQHQVDQYNIPENWDRPGTYQWEGLDDGAAQELIAESAKYLDEAGFTLVRDAEADATNQFRQHMEGWELEE